jgi:single-strand DNA-binding protein
MRALARASTSRSSAWPPRSPPANGKERPEYHNVVTWDRLAEICGQYLGKGQQVAIEGRIQTRSWDDDQGKRQCQV